MWRDTGSPDSWAMLQKAVVAGVTVGDAVNGITAKEDAPGSEPGSPFQFNGSLLRIGHGDVGDGYEAVGVVTAEVENPVVVDAAVGGGELVVGAFGFPGEAHGGVEDRGLDALGVQDFKALNGVYGAGFQAFAVGDLAGGRGGHGRLCLCRWACRTCRRR